MYWRHLLIGFIGFIFVATSGQAQEDNVPTPKFSGWVLGWYQADQTEDALNQFSLRSVRLIASGESAQKWGYHAMLELAEGGSNTPFFMQGWIYYKAHKYATLRMGQFKYPFGLEAYPSITTWKFINPAYITTGIVGKLGREGGKFRDIGLEIATRYPLQNDITLHCKAMVMNGTGINAMDNNDDKDFVVFVGIDFSRNITVGGSYYAGTHGENIINADDGKLGENALGFQFSVKQPHYTVQAEYISATYEQPTSLLPTYDIEPSGYYVDVTFFIISDVVEVGGRYDQFEPNSNFEDDVGNPIVMSRSTFSTAYYLNKVNRVSLNYEIREDDMNEDLDNLLTIQFQATF